MPIDKEQRAAIAESITRLERDFYGRGPSSVRVSCSGGEPEVITVLSRDTLTVADRTLVERGVIQAVISRHDALHLATWDDFCSEVAAIVGGSEAAARRSAADGIAALRRVGRARLAEQGAH